MPEKGLIEAVTKSPLVISEEKKSKKTKQRKSLEFFAVAKRKIVAKSSYKAASNYVWEKEKAKELKKKRKKENLRVFVALHKPPQKGLIKAVRKPPLIMSEKKKNRAKEPKKEKKENLRVKRAYKKRTYRGGYKTASNHVGSISCRGEASSTNFYMWISKTSWSFC